MVALWNQITGTSVYDRTPFIGISYPLNGVPSIEVQMQKAVLDPSGNPIGYLPQPSLTMTETQAASDATLGPLAYALNVALTNLIEALYTIKSTEPQITGLNADNAKIESGGTANITAEFINGTGVLTPGDLTVVSGTPCPVMPSSTTAYTLTVTNAGGYTATAGITIAVTPAVVIPSTT